MQAPRVPIRVSRKVDAEVAWWVVPQAWTGVVSSVPPSQRPCHRTFGGLLLSHDTPATLPFFPSPLAPPPRQGNTPLPIERSHRPAWLTRRAAFIHDRRSRRNCRQTMASSDPNANVPTPVSFPQPDGVRDANASPDSPKTRQRTSTNASTASSRLRAASIKLMEASPPPGMWAATGQTASKAPSLSDIRRGSFGSEGWNEELQRKRAGSRASQGETSPTEDAGRRFGPQRRASSNNALTTGPFPTLAEEETHHTARTDGQDKGVASGVESKQSSETAEKTESSASRQQPKRTPSGHVCSIRAFAS